MTLLEILMIIVAIVFVVSIGIIPTYSALQTYSKETKKKIRYYGSFKY